MSSMSVALHQIQYGNKMIRFRVVRKQVKNVNLNIKPDMSIEVSAAEDVPLDFIYEFVKGKGAWIIKHVRHFETVQPYERSEREYVSGESYKYLGKQYRLRVREVVEREEVKYFRGFIYMYVSDPDNVRRKEMLLENWYRERAHKIFQQSLDKLYPLVRKYEIPKPKVDIKIMKARWGSALIDSQTILLNFNLIKAPKHCIEYVILHELIHFRYNSHNESFYNMLYSLMPDWEKRKAILDEEIVRDL